ncbi:diguanylate cyclase (GGDEF) domain-containing protein [Gracilibacillus ureilyticus]|uniref:Diguanylate cyclase (GGDEF) domain-containing protein n=1 Tax=Gracilibacillus ureilyticus TaxID=531814 RepID=A0A1H9UT99_9BACI|nr:sensor domain-containing diguanylate cyclase [Gracilibacillus ureilyticus]SES12253.1 diguanylate cyclase (GGDEF) domain-containing protein [Gracilibacillus ureilyticus]
MEYPAISDLLKLVNQSITGMKIFLGRTTDETFTVIKTIDTSNTGIQVFDNQTIDIKGSYCQQIFFGNQEPLIINNTREHPFTSKLPVTIEANIFSYIGVPVFYKDGEMFGTLCALGNSEGNFTEDDIETLQSFSNLFSYVLELEKLAIYDPLTNLYNRRYLNLFFSNLENSGSLMFIDLDNFKQVNDLYGHDAGDEILIEVGNRISNVIKSTDRLVRLGGDEFVIILPNQTKATVNESIAKKLIDQLSNWEDTSYQLSVSASIGIVEFDAEDCDIKQLLKAADNALYEVKQEGKRGFKYA